MSISNTRLPRIKIGDHEYAVDFKNSEFRQLKDPSNTIPMYDLRIEDDQFIFWYDNQKARPVDEPTSKQVSPNVVRVAIEIEKVDPQYFANLKSEEQEAHALIRAGRSIYNNPDGIHANIPITGNKPRLLPMVNIYGTDFFLDLPLREFRQVDDPTNSIEWKALGQNHFHFRLLYDPERKIEFTGPLNEMSKWNVKLVHLPPLDKMIREGVARHEAMIQAKATKTSGDRVQRKKRQI